MRSWQVARSSSKIYLDQHSSLCDLVKFISPIQPSIQPMIESLRILLEAEKKNNDDSVDEIYFLHEYSTRRSKCPCHLVRFKSFTNPINGSLMRINALTFSRIFTMKKSSSFFPKSSLKIFYRTFIRFLNWM